MTETKLKKLSAKVVKANTAVLEDLFLNANLKMDWIDPSYNPREAQLVDVAIATLANYGNTVLLSDVFAAEELEHDFTWDARLMRAMTEIYALWVDKTAIIAREDNLLHRPEMTHPHWKALFDYQFANFIANDGTVMAYHRTHYGWADWDIARAGERTNARGAGIPVVAVFNLTEDYWNEFNGTFNTEDDSRTGFTAHVMYADGLFRDVRYVGSLGDIMRALS